MTIEKLCEELGIKGLVKYEESENYIVVKNYLYVKRTGEIIDMNK